MCVSNPDRSLLGINGCDTAPAPAGRAEFVRDDLPVFDATLCATAALRRAITEMGTSASKICWPKNQKPPVSFPVFRCDACLRQRAMIRHKPPYVIRYSRRLPHFWQVLKSITSVALGHCVRHSPETGGPSDRNCSRAFLRSDVVSVYYLQRSAISA
jgi:hypothetical protein